MEGGCHGLAEDMMSEFTWRLKKTKKKLSQDIW